MPVPTILPQPLSECSSAEIEKIVCGSESYLYIPDPLQVHEPYPLNIPNTKVARLHLVPGGRWLLAGCLDGSVWWLDLNHRSPLKPDPFGLGGFSLLLRSPLSEDDVSKNCARITFSIDHTSRSSGANPTGRFGPLDEFNLAVFVSSGGSPRDARTNSFQVWRVGVATGVEVRSHSEIKACLSGFPVIRMTP